MKLITIKVKYQLKEPQCSLPDFEWIIYYIFSDSDTIPYLSSQNS